MDIHILYQLLHLVRSVRGTLGATDAELHRQTTELLLAKKKQQLGGKKNLVAKKTLVAKTKLFKLC